MWTIALFSNTAPHLQFVWGTKRKWTKNDKNCEIQLASYLIICLSLLKLNLNKIYVFVIWILCVSFFVCMIWFCFIFCFFPLTRCSHHFASHYYHPLPYHCNSHSHCSHNRQPHHTCNHQQQKRYGMLLCYGLESTLSGTLKVFF